MVVKCCKLSWTVILKRGIYLWNVLFICLWIIIFGKWFWRRKIYFLWVLRIFKFVWKQIMVWRCWVVRFGIWWKLWIVIILLWNKCCLKMFWRVFIYRCGFGIFRLVWVKVFIVMLWLWEIMLMWCMKLSNWYLWRRVVCYCTNVFWCYVLCWPVKLCIGICLIMVKICGIWLNLL